MKTRALVCGFLLASVGCGADDSASLSNNVGSVPDDGAGIVAANNELALDLYRAFVPEADNLAYSPLSMSTALSMAYAGTAGMTKTEFESGLHYTGSDGHHLAYEALLKDLTKENAGYELRIANRIITASDLDIKDQFNRAVTEQYSASLSSCDFASEAAECAADANGFVEKVTNGRIKDLVKPADLDANSRMLLLNATYLNGQWLRSFNSEDTGVLSFCSFDDEPDAAGKCQLGTMTMRMGIPWEQGVGFAKESSYKALRLPLEGDRLSMLVLLPNEKNGLRDLELQLTADELARVAEAAKTQAGNLYVQLPKFKVESTPAATVALKALIPGAFGQGADFSAMSNEKLFIDAVSHKAFVEVSEKSLEAAAATAIEMGLESMHITPEPSMFEEHFIADHPFLFVVRDDTTGTVLFMGRFAKPSETYPL